MYDTFIIFSLSLSLQEKKGEEKNEKSVHKETL